MYPFCLVLPVELHVSLLLSFTGRFEEAMVQTGLDLTAFRLQSKRSAPPDQ
jgi:hypothetical protein